MKDVRGFISWIVALVPPVDGLVAKPRRVDVALAALLAIGSLVEFPFLTTPYPWVSLVGGLILAGAAVYRRANPLLAIVVAVAVAVGSDVLAAVVGEPLIGTVGGGLAVVVILYTVGRFAPPEILVIAVALGVFVVPAAGFLNPENDPAWAWLPAEMALTAVTIAFGVLVRFQEVLKTQRARAELAEERNHLANEIHDSVAHHMSAIAIRAEGARQLTDPTQRDEALVAIKQSASTGLNDVRHLISSIRDTDDMPKPLPGLGDLKQLAEESTTPTLSVEVIIDTAGENIPVTVAAVAYAIAREALTNVRRHATGATQATVQARGTEGFLDLAIIDDGLTPTSRTSTGGYGISVMAERAKSVGGSISAGPNPTGGWLVASRLPIVAEGAK